MKPTYVFDDQLAELVASGRKTQTIRRLRPDLPQVGDALQLFRFGPAKLLDPEPLCTSVQRIRIFRNPVTNWTSVEIDGERLISIHVRDLALADGFASTVDFLRYFERRGLPFEGVLIKWEQHPVAEIQHPVHPHMPPPAPECGTCMHEGKGLESWPCRTSMSAVGLVCYEPKKEEIRS